MGARTCAVKRAVVAAKRTPGLESRLERKYYALTHLQLEWVTISLS